MGQITMQIFLLMTEMEFPRWLVNGSWGLDHFTMQFFMIAVNPWLDYSSIGTGFASSQASGGDSSSSKAFEWLGIKTGYMFFRMIKKSQMPQFKDIQPYVLKLRFLWSDFGHCDIVYFSKTNYRWRFIFFTVCQYLSNNLQ